MRRVPPEEEGAPWTRGALAGTEGAHRKEGRMARGQVSADSPARYPTRRAAGGSVTAAEAGVAAVASKTAAEAGLRVAAAGGVAAASTDHQTGLEGAATGEDLPEAEDSVDRQVAGAVSAVEGALTATSGAGSGVAHPAGSEGDQVVSEEDLTVRQEVSEVAGALGPAARPALAGETRTGDHQADPWDPAVRAWDRGVQAWDPEARGWEVRVAQCRPGCRDRVVRACLVQMVLTDPSTGRAQGCWARAPGTSGSTSAARSG